MSLLSHNSRKSQEEAWTTSPVVCLCGSTRFKQTFEEENRRLTLAGYIVLSAGVFPNAPQDTSDRSTSDRSTSDRSTSDRSTSGGSTSGGSTSGGSTSGGIDDEQKRALDELHLEKIRLADEVRVLDVGGYIGESTRSEIGYARSLARPVSYYSSPAADRGPADGERTGVA